MPNHRRVAYLGLVFAMFSAIAGARPLLLPPAQRLAFPPPASPGDQNQYDPFVYRVAIDGDTAMVEARRAVDLDDTRRTGVYVFERDAAGQWNYIAPLTEEPNLRGGAPLIEGNMAAISGYVDGEPTVTVYERGATAWAQTGTFILPSNGAAFRLVDGALYVQFWDPFGAPCNPPLRQYRKVAGSWQHTATIGPQRCTYSLADVNQGRLVIGYAGGSNPAPPPLEIYADDGSANWPRVATPAPPAGSQPFPLFYPPYAQLGGNTMFVGFGHVYRANGNDWSSASTLIEPVVEANPYSTIQDGPRLRGGYLLLPGQERDYEPPVLQDSGPDLTYAWNILRVYRQRSDGGFDYYAKLNPENGIGTYGVSADGKRIIVSTSDTSFETGDYERAYVFEVPDSVSFPGTLQDDFESGNAGRWTQSAGAFTVASSGGTHVLRQSSPAGESGATYNDVDWTDQAIEADIRPTQFDGADRWFGLVARRTDAQNYYYATFRSTGVFEIKRMQNGVFTTLRSWSFPGGFVAGKNYRVRFEAVGEQLALFINGQGMIHVRDTAFTHGHLGLAGYKTSFDVDNVILTSGTRTLYRADGPVNTFSTAPPYLSTGSWNYLQLPDHQLAQRQSSVAGEARWVSRVATGNQVVSARVRANGYGTSSSGQDQWFGIAARYQNDTNYYYLTLRNSNRVSLRKLVNGAIQELGSAAVPVAVNTWYDLRLEIIGSRLRAFVDNELKVETTDPNAIGSGRNAMIMYKAAADYTNYFVHQP